MKVTWTAPAALCMLALGAQQLLEVDAAPKQQREENVCRSAGALKFDPAQRPMQRSKGLEVCSKYKKSTCCNETHTHALRLKIREPVVAKFNDKCQRITEEMVCSSCHPFMGTWQMKNVCPQLCNAWYSACQSEYYAYSGAGSLTPCYGNALICSPLATIASSGAEFCAKMGFHVGAENDAEGDECFDGSVPPHVGQAEPEEPWQTVLQRVFEEQSSDPSGAFMLVLFAPLVVLYVTFRTLRRKFDRRSLEDERHLQLLEVRRLQQERYGRSSYDDYDSDSDSVDGDDGARTSVTGEGGEESAVVDAPRDAPRDDSAVSGDAVDAESPKQ